MFLLYASRPQATYRTFYRLNQSLNPLRMSTNSSISPPPISHILETCLYVRDINTSTDFYQSALNMEPFLKTPRVAGFSLGSTTLLLFKLGSTQADITIDSGKAHGVIPGHGPSDSLFTASSPTLADGETRANRLNQHFCFAVQTPQDVEDWHTHFQKRGVRILGRMDWDLGGKSVYFQDPDGHVGEIGSRGIWKHYT